MARRSIKRWYKGVKEGLNKKREKRVDGDGNESGIGRVPRFCTAFVVVAVVVVAVVVDGRRCNEMGIATGDTDEYTCVCMGPRIYVWAFVHACIYDETVGDYMSCMA